MMTFSANQKQESALRGLAFWAAQREYAREYYGTDSPEASEARKSERLAEDVAAKNGIPDWVGAAVVFWAGEWRRYSDGAMRRVMEKKGIFFGAEAVR